MSHLVGWDRSDNNPVVHDFTGVDIFTIKLYPVGSSGHGWMVSQFAATKAWKAKHPNFRIEFYMADSTPMYSQAKAAALSIGVDFTKNEYALWADLREFGFSRTFVAAQITAGHKDGVIKFGEYYRLADLGTAHWKANYIGKPPEPWLLHQDSDHDPLDHSVTHEGVTLAEYVAATVGADAPTPTPGDDDVTLTDKQAAALAWIDDNSAKFDGKFEGEKDAANGVDPDNSKGPYYGAAYNTTAAAMGSTKRWKKV